MTEFLNILNTSAMQQDFTVLASISRLGYAFILNLFLAFTYKNLNSHKEDCHIIMHSIIYIGVIMAGAMMMIASNMVVAFGLLGAVSIVRFRTAVSNPIDMSYIFLAIVVGISCGLAFFVHALILTLFVGLLMLFLNRIKLGMAPPTSFNFDVYITFNKKHFHAESIELLKNFMGSDAMMMEIKTSKQRVKIKYSQTMHNLGEVQEMHDQIEGIFSHDPSLIIRISRK
ncbi:DUF4956 domain-containing protein [Oceanispirochaeta crateris]|uniref:DUF4956 domain-containing protein n=1 Tax=Oceanispirochaeta crateris TaxID=2518645 RepID=A0A5C1QHF4_9SPIO|nr:DUF4956 domain-containing protein [Oceanispirochaeta crateris]QEN07001.1 DUF4956 domain-containing protein [Oceanispirochaeta crateris]